MKRGIIWVILTGIILISLVLASCNSSTTTTATTSITSTTTTTILTTTTATSVVTTATTAAVTTTTTRTGNWWDSLGSPTYGGTLVQWTASNIISWDPYLGVGPAYGYQPYLQTMYCNAYTTDPSIWDFSQGYLPPQYADAYMMTGYEFTNPTTFVMHFRSDIYWQNIAPANGRQFVAADVVDHYDRILGLGNGYTVVDPWFATTAVWQNLISVTASDKYTVVFTWKPNINPLLIEEGFIPVVADNYIECPEAVTAYTNASNPAIVNWHYAIGTGPFLLTDFVDGSTATYAANHSYWGYDERWPQNRLPYLATYQVLIIPSTSTALAALRTGKIDSMGTSSAGLSAVVAQQVAQTNPSIIQHVVPPNTELTMDPRVDLAPYNNLNVRMALQEAINIPLIASTYYQGTATPFPCSLTQNQMGVGGWGLPYNQWPAALQQQYAFNTTNAKALLATAGYPNGFNTDIVLQNTVDMGLFGIVQSELAVVGINMSMTVMDTGTWQATVLNGHKQDALASRGGQLGNNYDPFRQLNRFTTGYSVNYMMISDPVFNAFYPAAQSATSVDQVKQILQQANLYVAQQFWCTCLAGPYAYCLTQPWVKGCSGATPLGPITYYGDWIDQGLKNSAQ
jgi:peptide/nickel transport system substrate-binding protein